MSFPEYEMDTESNNHNRSSRSTHRQLL